MKNHLFKYLACFAITVLFIGCNDSENYLLEKKIYFEKSELKLEVEDQTTIDYELSCRLSKKSSSTEDVTYAIADKSAVDRYNQRNGTDYEAFDIANVNLEETTTTISSGQVYSEKNILKLNNLDNIEEGKSYLVPIHITCASSPVVEGEDTLYLVLTKPVRILKVGKFDSSSIKVPLLPGAPFKSLTYEALIYIDVMSANKTIMGSEGTLILRIGDLALPGGANDLIQIAGSKQFHADHKFVKNKWYHVAFTYDQPTGKAIIYIDGEKAAESTWDTPSFDLTVDGGGFFIGKIDGFKWGERPLYGKMSEVRLWNVARTQNQLQQNMTNVDPKSEGLVAYYKLNGTDQYQADNSQWFVKDQSEKGMNGIVNGGRREIQTFELDSPLSIK